MAKEKTPPRYKNKRFLTALGTHCKRIRVKKGYSIDRMSKEGEQLSPGAIQRLETGAADVQVSLLYRYAQVLDIPLVQLFKFEENWNPEGDGILSFEENKRPPENAVPFFSLEIAAGQLNRPSGAIEPEGWAIVNKKGINIKDYFAARVYGKSMEPTISNGSLCLFKKYTGGSRQGKIFLIQARSLTDPETGGRFVIKRYERKTPVGISEDREHVVVHLVSDNPEFPPIVLKNMSEEDISTPAQFIETL